MNEINLYENDRKSLRRLCSMAAKSPNNKSTTRGAAKKTTRNKPTMTSNKRKSKNITNDTTAKLHAPQQHHKSADDYSIRKALGGGGAAGRGGEKKKSGGEKKSGGVKKSGNKGKITLPYLIENLYSMPKLGPRGLLQANKDLDLAQRCLMSKKSNNGSGYKACPCVGGKACNVKNCEDFIAYWSLSESERALLGPPGRPGTCKLLLFITHSYSYIHFAHILYPSLLSRQSKMYRCGSTYERYACKR